VRVNLLGPFSVTRGELSAGPWPRPERQLVLVSPGLRIGREAACEALFPALGAQSAANALSRALSMARAALSPLGDEAVGLLCADRGRIWAGNDLAVEVDQAAHEAVLHKGLAMAPGARRHELLASALGEDGALL
jgi:DNA-binding SARP family transcriptional activator